MKPQSKPIAIGCDHAGVAFKNEIIAFLKQNNVAVDDCGCYNNDSVDYPDIAEAVCKKINNGTSDKAILICGTGIGISMSANKIKGIRAALCHDYFSAKYTRLHNDANVICFGARVIGTGLACELVDIFLTEEFEGGRHAARVEKLMNLQNK
ncbi:ribose 5-phosphate isomerase B [Paludicola sp. MB14-C6]|uniref:ribose 5-phosphate isomerase B n=1 Tax=Paludihabitans sp. MB14-C6 TaxID=3070656 RepID=UPI0027DC7CEE|nr:ribose 5-phosphate isomerase B [Paludicola sp. MB14-C6]WMJ23612.1 ribose 5-phosphate isomerase B [Paludicola sp. MB14-C6]